MPDIVSPATEKDLLLNWQRTDSLLQKWQTYAYNLEEFINKDRTPTKDEATKELKNQKKIFIAI